MRNEVRGGRQLTGVGQGMGRAADLSWRKVDRTWL